MLHLSVLPSDFAIILKLDAAAIYTKIIQFWSTQIIVRSIDGKSLREVLYHYREQFRFWISLSDKKFLGHDAFWILMSRFIKISS